jgi:DNA-binding SARP family transcriptional activator/tetratricopeptide (TPR) repeat protein
MLSVRLLGDFCVEHDRAIVRDVDTPRLQSLLSYLMLHSDSPQSRMHLAFLFWPETTEDQARTNLRNLLHHLRHALPNADSYLDVRAQTLQWRPDAQFALDVADFRIALAGAERAWQSNDLAAVREALERAVAWYRGDLLPSCYDDWIIPQREALRQEFLSALESLISLLEQQRDYPAAIHNSQRLLRHDPLHEATYRSLIRLHALNDDRASALRAYHTCTTVLQRELGVEPSAATRDAYERLLGAESRPPPTMPAESTFTPLVGRERAWQQLLQSWQAVAAGGQSHVVILRGEAGIGKTRLAEDLLQWAARQGINCASAHCYAAEGELTYAPVTAWLRANPLAPLEDVWLSDVARLLPEISARRPDLARPTGLTEAWQRQRFEEALSRAILGLRQPLLLMLDDLQWCDRDTLEWLHFLLRFDPKARLLVVGAYRPEEIGEGHPLISALQALRLKGQVTEIELQPLDEAATCRLAGLISGLEISLETGRLLYRETEGNPLFVVETVRAGLPVLDRRPGPGRAPRPSDDLAPGSVALPPKVRSILGSRLAQLSPPSRELAELAAAIGREFSFDLLAEASRQDEDTLVRELDELWHRRIVREHGVTGYDFSHDKLREVVYGNMSSARRRLLHRHVARALKALHAADLDPVSHQLASHYERAGLPDQAIPFYLGAARVARRVYASEEAITLLQRGIVLAEEWGRGVSEDKRSAAAPLWEETGDILAMRARHEEAIEAYQNALSCVPGTKPVVQARLYRKTGAVRQAQRLYAEALDACRQAETVLGDGSADHDDAWWDEWLDVQVERVWAHYWLAQWPEMDVLVDNLQPVVTRRGKAASRLRFLMASCLVHLRKGRYVVSEEMLASSREALNLSGELGDVRVITDCRFELGFLHLWRRELDQAEENLLAALELADTSKIVSQRTLILTYLTVLHRFRGDMDKVAEFALQAQEAAEAARMPDYVAAARGNQAWLAWRDGDLPAAGQKGEEALASWRQSPLVYPFQWQALWPLIALAVAEGREDRSWGYMGALLAPTQQLLPDRLGASLEAALHAQAAGQTRAAQTQLGQAMQSAREMGYL